MKFVAAFTTLLAGAAIGAQLDSRFAKLQKEYNTFAPDLLKIDPQQPGSSFSLNVGSLGTLSYNEPKEPAYMDIDINSLRAAGHGGFGVGHQIGYGGHGAYKVGPPRGYGGHGRYGVGHQIGYGGHGGYSVGHQLGYGGHRGYGVGPPRGYTDVASDLDKSADLSISAGEKGLQALKALANGNIETAQTLGDEASAKGTDNLGLDKARQYTVPDTKNSENRKFLEDFLQT